MTTKERDAAQHVLGRILVEYGQADDRLGKEFYALADGNADVARECLMLMAAVHVKGATAHLRGAGLTNKEVAEYLRGLAADLDGSRPQGEAT